MAVRDNITSTDRWFTNEDKSFVFSIVTSDGITAQDITGWALSWVLKRRSSDSDASAAITKTTAGGGVALTDPTNGVCTVSVVDTDTVSLRPGLYFHELKRTDAGSETVLSHGSAYLQRSLHAS